MFRNFCFVFLFICGIWDANAQVNWENDYEKALQISKETGKPLLLDFTASWCGNCRRMEQTFWTRADVQEFSSQIVFVKLDADTNVSLKEKYNVSGLPHVIMTDSWGEKLDSHVGFGQNADRVIIEKLNTIPKNFSVLKQAGNAREKDKNDADALREFAEFYQTKKLYAFSIPVYQKILTVETAPDKRENAMLDLAFSHLILGQTTPALANLDRLFNEFPNSARKDKFFYGKILAQINRQNFQEAERLLEKLKNDFPQSSFISPAETRLNQFKARKQN